MRRLLALVALLALAPMASAAYEPSVYYLRDEDSGPTAAGTADEIPPDANNSQSMRVLFFSDASDPGNVFHLPASDSREIRGTALAGVWLAVSPSYDVNVSATLYVVDASGAMHPIGNASQAVSLDPSEVPEPTSLIPPDPTDPEGAAFHVAAQAMPLLDSPPLVYAFEGLSVDVGADEHLALGLYMSEGAAGAPLGQAIIAYDAADAPSFVYVPWFEPDPPADDEPAMDDEPDAMDDEPEAMDDEPDATDDEPEAMDDEVMDDEPDAEAPAKKTPAPAALVVVALAAAFVARRRQS